MQLHWMGCYDFSPSYLGKRASLAGLGVPLLLRNPYLSRPQGFTPKISGASEFQLHLPAPRDPALKRLATRLAEGPKGAENLATLAREVGLSERSLFRNFKKETGLGPGQWRRQMQVLRSLELLADGRSVTETSFEVGYESTGAFIRAFRQTVGVTPTVYALGRRSS
jgi:AraC-like DNA-binding protein